MSRTSSPIPSPLPQGYAGGGGAPVRITNGFTQVLPGRTRLFFSRQYFATYPRPIQQGNILPFPRTINVAKIQAPERQCIVMRRVNFRAYIHSGIGIDDISELATGRGVGTLGFKFAMGNRGITDFQTNLPNTGVPIAFSTAQAFGPVGMNAGQGSTRQGAGPVSPNTPGEAFAAYARPKDLIQADCVIMRPPSFDLRFVSVEMEGWLAEEKELDSILDSLSR